VCARARMRACVANFLQVQSLYLSLRPHHCAISSCIPPPHIYGCMNAHIKFCFNATTTMILDISFSNMKGYELDDRGSSNRETARTHITHVTHNMGISWNINVHCSLLFLISLAMWYYFSYSRHTELERYHS
jgi:hypothetical protein